MKERKWYTKAGLATMLMEAAEQTEWCLRDIEADCDRSVYDNALRESCDGVRNIVRHVRATLRGIPWPYDGITMKVADNLREYADMICGYVDRMLKDACEDIGYEEDALAPQWLFDRLQAIGEYMRQLLEPLHVSNA